jgi:hypothetical protein
MSRSSAAPQFKVLYILGTGRCGSTLLARLLNQQPGCVAVGEMRRLHLYLKPPPAASAQAPAAQWLCSCGQAVAECSFWRQVEAQYGQALANAQTSGQLAAVTTRRLLQMAWLAAGNVGLRATSKLSATGRSEVRAGETCWDLYEGVARATGAKVIIDSSKTIYHYLILRATARQPLMVLDLKRDGRAVVHSMTRDQRAQQLWQAGPVPPFEQAASHWVKDVERSDYVFRRLPAAEKCSRQYENLCRQPAEFLQELFAWLGEPPQPYETWLSQEPFHLIGGSPSRLDQGRREITLDSSWRKHLTPEQLQVFERLAGPLNRQLGYND